jgi:hypothetical protein
MLKKKNLAIIVIILVALVLILSAIVIFNKRVANIEARQNR